VRSFFGFLLDEGVLETDPSLRLPAPRGWKRIPRCLSEEEVERLLGSIRHDNPLSMRDRAMLEFAYGTGARVSEILQLRLEDLDLESAMVRLRGKGGKVRVVPLGRPAVDALSVYLERARVQLAQRTKGRRESTVFLNSRGGGLSRMGFWKILRKSASEAGLQGVHPHLLRHSYATHMLRRGAPLRAVQELLGHARLSTTQVYVSVDESYLERVYREHHPRG